MNIKTREQFDALLHDLRNADIFSVDSEANGLSVFEGNRPISLSFYFPEWNSSYNFAWAHGVGTIHIPAENRNTAKFHDWSWQGAGKKQVYKSYWYDLYRKVHADEFGNLPHEWFLELRTAWNEVVAGWTTVVYFNAPFDIHMMESVGFNQPAETEDVRIAVALVFEDWLHPSIRGENRLKWQADYWKIEGALDGETELQRNAEELSNRVAALVSERWDDPMNASFHKLKRPARIDEIAKRLDFNPKSEMWCLPADDVAMYAENDTRITWLLRKKLYAMLKQWHQVKLYHDLSDAQAEFLIRMERGGLLLDRDEAERQIDELVPVMEAANQWFCDAIVEHGATLSDAEKEVFTDARGRFSFTIGSPKKLKAALTLLTGETWESTDKETVTAFEEAHDETFEAVERLQDYRHAHRASTVYLKKWIESQDEYGYIHGGFNINGTVTGRLSSSSGTLGDVGNMQNVPSRGFDIKKCLIAPEGWGLFQFDYGQLELRLASWIAGCTTMTQMFESGEDMHAYTRDSINVGAILHPGMSLMQAAETASAAGKLKKQPTDEASAKKELASYYRQVAKTLNFGLLYSGSWRMVSRLLRLGEAEATELHRAWHALYPEFSEANEKWTSDGLRRRPRPDGTGSVLYVAQPISGRTRKYGLYPVSETLRDKDGRPFTMKTRERAAKDAFNFAVQGLGGYMMVMSSLKMCREFDQSFFHPVASIHDSIVAYIRSDCYDIVPQIRDIMTDWDVRPRLTADAEYSPTGSWQDLKAITDVELFVSSRGTEGY